MRKRYLIEMVQTGDVFTGFRPKYLSMQDIGGPQGSQIVWTSHMPHVTTFDSEESAILQVTLLLNEQVMYSIKEVYLKG